MTDQIREVRTSRPKSERADIEDCFYAGNHPTGYPKPCSPPGVIVGCRECNCGRYGTHVKGCLAGRA